MEKDLSSEFSILATENDTSNIKTNTVKHTWALFYGHKRNYIQLNLYNVTFWVTNSDNVWKSLTLFKYLFKISILF